MIIDNEFAAVDVEVDTNSHDPRLRITDLNSGMTIFLDALELQALAWARHEDLVVFTRPEFREMSADRFLGGAVRNEAVREAETILRENEPPPGPGQAS